MPELVDRIHESLGSWGSHPVLIDLANPSRPVVWPANALKDRIASMSRQLRGLGVHSGQCVAVFLDNSADFTLLFLALLELGAVSVPLKREYRALELGEIFADARPGTVITEAGQLGQLDRHLKGLTVIARERGALSLVQAGDSRREPDISPEIASLNYTYRGLGFPLGAMVPHDQYIACSEALQGRLEGRVGQRMLVVLPMAHIFSLIGCLFVPLLYRMTAVILPGFTPRNVFSAMRVHHVDYLTAVPELLGLMARVRPAGLRLPGLEAFVSGGSHLSAEADARIRQAFGVEILHGYGLTEFAPACGNVRGKTVPGSAGPECQNARVRIANPDTQGQGEILIRSDRMFRGYYRKPEETSRSWTGGWFRTGDLGRFAGGSLVFVRELKPTCKINGAMVDLAEVRRAIVSLPGIESADVDCREGQLVACVEGVHLDREGLLNLRRALGELVAWYKVPRRILAPAGDSGR